jgi:hypothetical protein
MCYQTIFPNLWMKIIKCTSVQDPWHAYALVTDKSHLSASTIVALEDNWIFLAKTWLKTRISVRIYLGLEICQPPGLHPSQMLSSVTAWPWKMGPISCPESSVTTNKRCITFQKREDLNYTMAAAWNLALINLSVNDSNKSYKTKFGLVSYKYVIIVNRWQPKLNSLNIFYRRTSTQNFIKANQYFWRCEMLMARYSLPIMY